MKAEEDNYGAFDDIFKKVRAFGPYQRLLVLGTNFLLVLAMGCQFFILIYGYGTVPFRCTTPNVSCPFSQCCGNCTDYEFLGPIRTFVVEFNLICERAYFGATIQSCFYGGTILGVLVAGVMSDVFGRRLATYLFNFVMIASSLGAYFVNSSVVMAVLMFISGAGTMGTHTAFYVYFMEHIGPKSRTWNGTFHGLFWGFHSQVFTLVAYFITYWRNLVLFSALSGVPIYFFCSLIPRSPRWLITQDRLDEAHSVIMKYGAKKGKTLNPEALKALIEKIRQDEIEKAQKEKKSGTRLTALNLFKTPKLRKRMIIMFFLWFGQVFLGNAFFLYMSHLSGDIYINFILFNVIPIPLTFLSGLLLQKFGRRLTASGVFTVTGVLCFCALAVPTDNDAFRTGLFITASSILVINWNSLYLMMSELFPTVLRTTSFGVLLTIGRVGGILAPYMGVLAQHAGMYFTLPFIVFGTSSLAFAVLVLFLPETVLSNMHQTIEEAEGDKEYYGMPCCFKPEVTYNEVREVEMVDKTEPKAGDLENGGIDVTLYQPDITFDSNDDIQTVESWDVKTSSNFEAGSTDLHLYKPDATNYGFEDEIGNGGAVKKARDGKEEVIDTKL